MVEYVKLTRKAVARDKDDDQVVVPTKGVFPRVINVIHGIIRKTTATKNALKARYGKAQLLQQYFPFEVMSIATPKKDKERRLMYELSFNRQDLNVIDILYNDVLALMVNINNFDAKRVLIDPGSCSEIMYLNMYSQLKPRLLRKAVRSVDMPVYSFSEEAIKPVAIIEVLVIIGPALKNIIFFCYEYKLPIQCNIG